MNKQYYRRVALISLLGLATNLLVCATDAQTFTTIKRFRSLTNVGGFHPTCQLVQGDDGTLYGTATDGEGLVRGTIFQFQPDGSGFTVLKWFTNSNDGFNPNGSLTLSGNVLYGSTSSGGSNYQGVVFKLNTDGTGFGVLKSFSGAIADPYTGVITNSDGSHPYAGLTLSGNTLYGTTWSGGNGYGGGTVFKMNTDGTGFTVLKNCNESDGDAPKTGLTLSGGTLYGATTGGGSGTW